MGGLVFNGHDFGEVCQAQTVEVSPLRVRADAVLNAGAPGAKPTGGGLDVRRVKVRLALDAGRRLDAEAASRLRHRIDAMLCAEAGSVLRLPEDEALEYHDALLTDAEGWTTMRENGSCTLTFTCFDPVAFGAERTTGEAAFEVGGSAETWPRFELVAAEGDSVTVLDLRAERFVSVVGDFAGGEIVAIDCADEHVTIDCADADASVGMYSDFFPLAPGACELAFAGCLSHSTSYVERWL